MEQNIYSMSIKHQPSPEIREFLTCYLLEAASDGPLSLSTLAAELARRTNGDLQPSEDDLRAAWARCCERGWLACSGEAEPARLTPEGKAESARLREAHRTDPHGHVEQATELLFANLPAPDEGEVLDVGTGEGRVARALAERGYQVLAIDVDEEAISRAREQEDPHSDRIRFQVADVRDLARSGARFPAVCSSYVLHECDDPAEVLAAMCECLAEDGSLISLDFAPNLAAYVSGAGRSTFHAFRALAEGDWRHLAPRLGLKGLEYRVLGCGSLVTARRNSTAAPRHSPKERRDS